VGSDHKSVEEELYNEKKLLRKEKEEELKILE